MIGRGSPTRKRERSKQGAPSWSRAAFLAAVTLVLGARAPVITPAVTLPAVTQFPPSFDGNEWAYGWALFGLLTVCAMSAAYLLRYASEGLTYGWSLYKPIALARMVMVCMFSTILLGALPDAIFLLTWGEVPPAATQMILLVDRICDALTVIPFLCAAGLLVRAEAPILFMLTVSPVPVDLWPTWPMVRRSVAAILLIIVIAAGVTLAK
ncbi:hypothetical protein [Sphingomonas paucimobilis]|uniref:hypothetical protein n=1 Tax=Sphingomonas paucimobilis TaxID=13689 RepID=UPI00242CB34F|nr:hypothetical protein [Sphingomonas paucimobilis]